MSLSPYSVRSASSGPLIDLMPKSKSSPLESGFFSIPHTPYEERFQVLVKGNFPLQILECLSAFFSKTSEGMQVEVEDLCWSQNLENRKPTASQPLVIKIDSQKVALFKPRQREPGSKAWLARYPDIMVPKYFCTSGTGAFMELVCSLFIDHCMQMYPDLKKDLIIPKVAYVQMGHPNFYLQAKWDDLTSPILIASPKQEAFSSFSKPVRGTGSLHEFIQNSRACTMSDFLQKPVVVQEFIAIMHMLLLNSDAHIGNMLVSQDLKLVMIDHSYTLAVNGLEGGRFFWIHNPQFKNPISADMKGFILNIEENLLVELLEKLQNELSKSLKDWGEDPFVEGIEIGENRSLVFKIVLQFLKQGVLKDLTISDFANFLSQKNPSIHEGFVFQTCQNLSKVSSDKKDFIKQSCEKKIADFLLEKQQVLEFSAF